MKPPSYYIKKYEDFIVEHGEFSYIPNAEIIAGECLFNADTVIDALANFEDITSDFGRELTKEELEAKSIIEGFEQVTHAYNELDLIDIAINNMEVFKDVR